MHRDVRASGALATNASNAERRSRPAQREGGLSLILPAYNEEAVIAEAIREAAAALPAVAARYEILIVDDGSTDQTFAAAREEAADHPHVRVFRHARNYGYGAALRTGVPIVPLSVVGAEEIYPLVGNVPSLARLLGVPYIPITPFFPALGPLGLVPLPSKWILEFGEPIRTDEYDEHAAEDPMLVFNVTDQVRETIQQTLYQLLMQRTSVFR